MTDTKTLYLMRHAEASWMDAGQRDFNRPLDPQGERDAVEMGQRLKKRGVFPSVIISSPACRAVQTATLIAGELGLSPDAIMFNKCIYEAAVSDLLDVIQAIDDSRQSALLVGHNPALTWVINQLTGDHIANAPTCSVATLKTLSPRWEDSNPGTADLLDFDYPGKTAS